LSDELVLNVVPARVGALRLVYEPVMYRAPIRLGMQLRLVD